MSMLVGRNYWQKDKIKSPKPQIKTTRICQKCFHQKMLKKWCMKTPISSFDKIENMTLDSNSLLSSAHIDQTLYREEQLTGPSWNTRSVLRLA